MRQLDDVIPLPASVRPDPSADFTIGPDTSVSATASAADLAGQLTELLREATGQPIPVSDNGSIRLLLEDADDDRSPESYRLDVTADGLTLRAPGQAGLFAGLQTIRQLLPADPAGPADGQAQVTLPGGRIEDEPRFAYRGTMLDLARHFFTPDEIKKHIDTIVQFKINHLHLHLTCPDT
jgi:hexosaminidase